MTGNCSAFTPTHLWHCAVAEAQCVPLPPQFISKMYNRLTPTLYVHRGNSISSTHTAGSLHNSTAGQVHQLKQLQHINTIHKQLEFYLKLYTRSDEVNILIYPTVTYKHKMDSEMSKKRHGSPPQHKRVWWRIHSRGLYLFSLQIEMKWLVN